MGAHAPQGEACLAGGSASPLTAHCPLPLPPAVQLELQHCSADGELLAVPAGRGFSQEGHLVLLQGSLAPGGGNAAAPVAAPAALPRLTHTHFSFIGDAGSQLGAPTSWVAGPEGALLLLLPSHAVLQQRARGSGLL